MAESIDYNLSSKSKFDWQLLFIVIAILSIGLISIYSATHNQANIAKNFNKQIIAGVIGFFGMLIITYLPRNTLKLLAYPAYGTSIFLLIIVLIFGDTDYGTRGWINLGGFNLQPAEFAKFGLILGLAKYIGSRGVEVTNIRGLGISLLLVILPFYLILKQPDFGSATVLLVIYYGVLLWSGFNGFILYSLIITPVLIIASLFSSVFFYLSVVIAIAVSLVFRQKIWLTTLGITIFLGAGFAAPTVYEQLAPHQKKRIDSFLDPTADPKGAGYNVIQSKLAVGSGGITGKGFMKGSQTQLKFVPFQWTDFIFSVPAEEFGFVGAVVIVLLYLMLLLRSLNIAYDAEDKFTSIVSIGVLFVFIYHILINIGMVIGLMPVMGIPLPFMSYGGTSLIQNLSFIGLLLNVYRQKRIRKR